MPASVAPPDNPQKRRELGGAGGAGKAGGSGKAGGGIRAPVPTSRVPSADGTKRVQQTKPFLSPPV